MKCNATLTTATETDEVLAHRHDSTGSIAAVVRTMLEGDALVMRGDRLLRLDLHTHECGNYYVADCREDRHHSDGTYWTDNTKGATPHVEPEPECQAKWCDDGTITGTDLPCTQCNATPHVEPDVTVTDAVVKALWEEFAPNLPGYITYGDIQTVAYDALRAQAGDA